MVVEVIEMDLSGAPTLLLLLLLLMRGFIEGATVEDGMTLEATP